MTRTVLVLGGYGFFGERISAALAAVPGIHLLLAGRDRERARATARALRLPAERAVELDAHDPRLAARLEESQVDLLIHTAGPFQGQNYDVARAAIVAGCHYIDLADGRRFVAGIGDLDSLARGRGVTVISGASSVPALSAAVVDRYLPQFAKLESIRLGISTGGRLPGLASVRGVFGYCGKPFLVWEGGRWITTHGWLDLHRHRFPPPVDARWLGRCDVPDLDLFPHRYPSVHSVSFHAGIASGVGHLIVWGLAQLVRAGVLSDAQPMAKPLHRTGASFEPLLSRNGAMFVTLTGIGLDGGSRRTTWNLVARQNHGPHIPCGAAIALARKLAEGKQLPTGAMPCMGLLSVEEYLEALHGLDIEEIVD